MCNRGVAKGPHPGTMKVSPLEELSAPGFRFGKGGTWGLWLTGEYQK